MLLLANQGKDYGKLQSMKLYWVKLYWVLNSLFILVFVNCTGGSGGVSFFDKFRARQTYLQAGVSCPTGDCPSFVGGLYSLSHNSESERYDLSGCAVSLIGPDRILTNSHCIPEDISQMGGSCRDSIRIVFPKTKEHPLETFNCLEILNKSSVEKKPNHPDWAVLKLDKASARKPVDLNLNGIERMESVTLYKIDFHDFSPSGGTVVKTNCLANTDNVLAVDFLGPVGPLFNISDCDKKLIIGNSGSAILDKEGKLIGLFSFISSEPNNHPSYLNGENITGGGTNGICIPFENHQIPERCEFEKEEYGPLAIRYAYWLRMKQGDRVKVDEIHRKNISLHSSTMRFALSSQSETELFFNPEEPMVLLKSDFINGAFPFLFPSFPECVYQGMSFSFQVVLGSLVPDFFHDDRLFGVKDKSNNSVSVESRIWKQPFLFQKRESNGRSRYKVTMVAMENNPLADLLLLKPSHDFHFYVPVCE